MGKTKQELNMAISPQLEKTTIAKNSTVADHFREPTKMILPRGYKPMIIANYQPLPKFSSGCSKCN